MRFNGFGFLLPLRSEVWVVVGCTVFIFACYLTIVSHLSPYGAHGHYFQSEDAEKCRVRQDRRRSSLFSLAGQSTLSVPAPKTHLGPLMNSVSLFI